MGPRGPRAGGLAGFSCTIPGWWGSRLLCLPWAPEAVLRGRGLVAGICHQRQTPSPKRQFGAAALDKGCGRRKGRKRGQRGRQRGVTWGSPGGIGAGGGEVCAPASLGFVHTCPTAPLHDQGPGKRGPALRGVGGRHPLGRGRDGGGGCLGAMGAVG